jgi:cellulose synthase/poly-beta-1,6-N-acetylglucosamine synthase-like glycosyltransferase
MRWYFYIALAAILSQLVFLAQIYRNYRYALSKYKRKSSSYQPKVALLVPCKGLDRDFTKNIASFFNQDYKNYLLWFVVADESDPAYAELRKLKNSLSQTSKAQDIQIHVAGQAQSCGQKNHNLLHCYRKIGDDVEVLAFADSDIRVNSDWLNYLVYPLRKPKNGVTTGYRWFVPQRNNLATLALSAVNAKVAQLLGDTFFNQAWGGSMAVRLDVFRRLGIDKIWANSLSDDLSLSTAVKKAGLEVVFAPACLVASYESTTWRQLFEFGRRQFLITRVNAPKIWWFGLCSSLYSILGLWAGAALAIYAAGITDKNLLLFATVPVLFFTSQFIRAILRQKMIGKLLEDDAAKMKASAAADIFFFWVWSFLLLFLIISSSLGRTVRWRRIRYKLLGPTRTIVIR